MATLTNNAKVVLEKRYLLRDSAGQLMETPEGLFKRVSSHIAQGDAQYGASEKDIETLSNRFYTAMTDLVFLPNSPTLMNAGKPQGQLSACFVLPVADSLEGIFDTLKHAALIHQSGGGTGFSFSRLRPAGDQLKYTSGVTSGPLSFMDVYNAATEAIKQGGTRRGANMGILRVDHPDIESFITAKNDLSRLTNFNISVGITNAFMEAVEKDASFDLIHPNTGKTVKSISAKALMAKIIDSAWQTGEPGLVFLDRINTDNMTPELGEMEATNPCGEVPLLPYEACNLGSINIGRLLKTQSDKSLALDWKKFRETIHLAVHFLENVIVQNNYPLDEIRAMVDGNRKIGLGLMGWADLLVQLDIAYNSEEALKLAEDVIAFMNYESKKASVELAKKRGPFPFFKQSLYAKGHYLTGKYATDTGLVSKTDWEALDNAIAANGIRHATTLCLAPTGTISMIAGASGGIEPMYALVFERNVLEGTCLLEVNSFFKTALEKENLYSDQLLQQVAHLGSIQQLDSIPQAIKALFMTAHDIAPEWHIRMQAAFQSQCDNAVSKTINFAETASKTDIEAAYFLAYRMGLKGITVYRNNSRALQPMKIDSRHCPDCKKPLVHLEGCLQCPDCQYAFCG